MSDGKESSIIVVKWNSELSVKSVTKSISIFFPRVVSNTKGCKEEESCQVGLTQLQKTQLEERALQSTHIQTFPSETFSQTCQQALPILMVNIIVTFNKQQDIRMLCQAGYNRPIMVGIQSI